MDDIGSKKKKKQTYVMLLPIVWGGYIVYDFSIKSVTATYQTSQEESNAAWELRQGKELCNEGKALFCLQTLGVRGIAM